MSKAVSEMRTFTISFAACLSTCAGFIRFAWWGPARGSPLARPAVFSVQRRVRCGGMHALEDERAHPEDAHPTEWAQRVEDARVKRKAERVEWKKAHPAEWAQLVEDAGARLEARVEAEMVEWRNAHPAEWAQRVEDARAELKAEVVEWKKAHPAEWAQVREDARVSLNAERAERAEKRHARAAEEGAHADHAINPEIDRLRQEVDRLKRNQQILDEEFASRQASLSDFLTDWRPDERISNSLDRDALRAACKANFTNTAVHMLAENDRSGNPELSEELLSWSNVRPGVQAHIRRIRARNRQRDERMRQDPESARSKRYVMLKEAAHQVYEARGTAFRALCSCRSKHQHGGRLYRSIGRRASDASRHDARLGRGASAASRQDPARQGIGSWLIVCWCVDACWFGGVLCFGIGRGERGTAERDEQYVTRGALNLTCLLGRRAMLPRTEL